jgi:hypothetical protein
MALVVLMVLVPTATSPTIREAGSWSPTVAAPAAVA